MAELKNFSASEIALHSSKKDCWLVVDGKVYDVTGFLEDHPGGEEVLLYASGTGDATQSFEDVGHSSSAKSMMNRYLIGNVEGYDADFRAALKEKVAAERRKEDSRDFWETRKNEQTLQLLDPRRHGFTCGIFINI
ncbi:uncharacterized protein LOC144716245 isoform X2 [Wolffia australiana]